MPATLVVACIYILCCECLFSHVHKHMSLNKVVLVKWKWKKNGNEKRAPFPLKLVVFVMVGVITSLRNSKYSLWEWKRLDFSLTRLLLSWSELSHRDVIHANCSCGSRLGVHEADWSKCLILTQQVRQVCITEFKNSFLKIYLFEKEIHIEKG